VGRREEPDRVLATVLFTDVVGPPSERRSSATGHGGSCSSAITRSCAGSWPGSVNVGARVASLAGPAEVLASSTVKDLVAGSGIEFEERGEHELKGIPGAWRVFAVAVE
jgi:class 3 adenylate cyclase